MCICPEDHPLDVPGVHQPQGPRDGRDTHAEADGHHQHEPLLRYIYI